MIFWANGQKFDTATIGSEDAAKIHAEFVAEMVEVSGMLVELQNTSNVREFSLKHFGRDGERDLYTDKAYTTQVVQDKLQDLQGSDRAKALRVLGLLK